MTTNIHYLIAGMAVLLVVIWQYSRQRQMDDRNSRMFRRLLSVVSLDVAAELVSTGFILYAPYSFNVCRMLSNTVFYLFQALLPLLLLYYVCTLCTSRVIAPSVVLRMGIPTIALVCIILTNPFTEMLFYFDGTGYRIVAEGVETQEEMELLRSWNVDMIQGYYFSRPLPPDDLLRLLTGSAEMQAENQA